MHKTIKMLWALWTLLVCMVVTTSADAELVCWWKFDGNYEDSSGNGNHGSPVGTPTFEAGQFGQALRLNLTTTDQYVNCGTRTGFTTIGDGGTATGMTVAVWINRSAIGGDRKICGNLSESTWGSGHGFQFAVYNNY